MTSPITNFRLGASDFMPFGRGLTRPECVWSDPDGIWVSDNAAGGVAKVADDGPQQLGSGIREPNGFARRRNGAFVVAGLEDHRLYEVSPDGRTRTLVERVDGCDLGVVNCAWVDSMDRVWASVMTPRTHWYDALNSGPEGYIFMVDERGARIVADGLHLTNEVKLDAQEGHLYAVESLARRIVRFPVRADGSLGARETVGPADLGYGAFPDGFAFDADGNIWLTLITRNAIAIIDRTGALHTVFEEVNQAALTKLVDAVGASRATRDLMAACFGPTLKLPTSLAFGGPDGRTAYVGSLAGSTLATFRAPVAGRGFTALNDPGNPRPERTVNRPGTTG